MALFIGLIIGIILGLTGAGGSILAVPLLLFSLNLSALEATGLSLGVVAISSLFGAIVRIIDRQVLWVPVVLFGAGGIVFAPVGRLVSGMVEPHLLRFSFAALAIMVALRMAWQSGQEREYSALLLDQSQGPDDDQARLLPSDSCKVDWQLHRIVGLLAAGVLTGFLSGFFGVGGGFLIVPFLNQLNQLSMRLAVSTSLVIIACISFSGFVTELLTTEVNVARLILLSLGGIAGMIVGTVLSRHISGLVLQRIFAATVIVMAVLLLVKK